MGYLDNSSITVDAILTKKGRELLAQGGIGSFQITQFALADDEIDYTMFNENHPNGTQYSGEAIENMAITEAFPDENNIMQYKLLTLNEGTSAQSAVVVGSNLQLQAKSASSLFGTFDSLTTTLTVEGLNTGARTTIPITVNKTVTNYTTTSGDSTTNTTNSSAGV